MPNSLPHYNNDNYQQNSFATNNNNYSSSNFLSPNSINDRQSMVNAQSRRKFSFPATLHSASLLEVNKNSTRRRLSNVSDVVTRKLSYSIGWKAAQIPAQDIITQGRCLCGQYIKRRLRRSGLFNKKLGLQRIRSILGTSTISVVREVFPAVMVLGDELERMHPRIYTGVARQICRNPGGEFQTADTVILLLSAVARDLFRIDITWSKIISLFAIAGGLSVDCVRQGHPEYLPKLMQSVSDVIEDELVPWINENGGWGKCLCGQYIRARLRRAGVLNRKAIQRLRCILEPSSEVVYEVFPTLNSMGEELEGMHPRIYTNVSRQLSRAPYGELVDSDTAPMLLNLVAKELFSRNQDKERITWAKIISVFAVCGGFAIDCVRQGHYDYLQFLIDGVGDIIEDDLVQWLAERGGWLGLQQHIRPKGSHSFRFLDWLTLFVAISASLYLIANFIKHFGCHCYSLLF